MITIRLVSSPEPGLLPGLSALLIDAVRGGASVGFLWPLSQETAHRYWEGVFAGLNSELFLWVAQDDGEVVGSVQMAPCGKENGRHRAEIWKLFVHSQWRGQGIARQLLDAAEAFARADRRTLLVLDTEAGSDADFMYRHLGWQAAGEIPDYAARPNGQRSPTVFLYKRLLPLGA